MHVWQIRTARCQGQFNIPSNVGDQKLARQNEGLWMQMDSAWGENEQRGEETRPQSLGQLENIR